MDLCLWRAIFVILIPQSFGIICHFCRHETDLSMCSTVINCSYSELCEGNRTLNGRGGYIYTLGCRPKSICDGYVFGRRSAPLIQCCSTNYCNKNMFNNDPVLTSGSGVVSTQSMFTGKTSLPLCVDHDIRCTQSAYKQILCHATKPDMKTFAIMTCPVSCNYCKEYMESIEQTLHPTTTAQQTLHTTTPSQQTLHTTTLTQQTLHPTTPSQETLHPTTTAEPVICHVCGDTVSKVPCSPTDIFENGPTDTCPSGKRFCMTDFYQDRQGGSDVFKRCVTETECQQKWINESADQDYCSIFGTVPSPETFECHFCCTGDRCNTDLIPPSSTLVAKSTGK